MRINFRFTNSEYQEFRQLNRTVATPRWKSYCLALLCLIPSFCLILGTNSLIAILAAATLLISVLGIAIIAAIGDKPTVDQYDHLLTLDQSTAHESQSHSFCETRWDYYDTFEESDSFYLLGRLDRFTAIPKRVIENDQLEEFTSYCSQAINQRQREGGNESVTPGQQQPVPLFSELFSQDDDSEVYRFAYQSNDLAAAMSDRLRVVDFSRELDSPEPEIQAKPITRQNMLGTFWLVIFCGILIYIILSAPSRVPLAERWNYSQIAFLVLAIILPFLLMKWLNRWFRARQKRNSVRVPTETVSMMLRRDGWAIGNPKSCQFFDWRDVDVFYQNNFCFGFHTFNDLVQIIPKRIFAHEEESEQFLNQAISYRREHLRSFADTAVAVETGNPYQAPTS